MGNSMIPLFHAQVYQDAWDDYQRSLHRENFIKWDYVILTASNEQQAEGFRAQIKLREEAGFLPEGTQFAVLPDPEGKRVGSGGATLNVIRYIAEQENTSDFNGLRILVIHSGGDSKRVPQYSALGKLFSPVPRLLPNGQLSTLFDEFLISMAGMPSRIREGMLLLSGDVLLLFNPLLVDYSGKGAAAISFKEDVQTGKNHGVYLMGENGNVARCLQKQNVETLKAVGAVNESGSVDIDTGAVIFSSEMLRALFSLVSTEGRLDEKKYFEYVNETVRISLYADFLYPLAEDSTLENFYEEKPEGDFSSALTECRKRIWEVLRPFRMKLLRLAPAKFIHFGTTREILQLMCGGVEEYKALDWRRQIGSSIKNKTAGYNSILSSKATIGDDCYLEVSFVHSKAKVGDHVILSYVDIHDEKIPDQVVIHGLKQQNGKFVARIYGVEDNPKENFIFGTDLNEVAEMLQTELWHDSDHSLWNAEIYPEKDTIREAVNAALGLYRMIQNHDMSAIEEWRSSSRKSLCSGFLSADPEAIIAWNRRMHELVLMDEIAKSISNRIPARNINSLPYLTKIQKEWMEKRLLQADYREQMRLHYYVGTALGSDSEIQKCFGTIQSVILKATLQNLEYNETSRIVADRHTVKLPLRVNWGGGWSDTPPYCNENGGTVLNMAILLNGEKPVEVTLEKIPEYKIVFDSRDMDVHGEFDTIEPLQKTGDPMDPFALQKACLLACGIIPSKGNNLIEILKRLGGGFVMHSEVTNVPKGSGLGTSSILSAACVKAVFEFMGISYTENDLYSHVLAMEQIMSTGGGWQDQAGGVTPGLKYITSRPGIDQKISVTHVILSEKTKTELQERFALIYTGQRRLARNLLRDVIGRYVGNEPDSLFALNEIQRVAALMRFELERENVDEFAKLLDYHWELSQKVDKGSTNTLIDQIFSSIDDFIDGRLVCGAGGGGFLQVILKKGVTKEEVHKRLKSVFQDSPVDVWDCQLIW